MMNGPAPQRPANSILRVSSPVDVHRIMLAKGTSKISVVIPARNEEATIGHIVATLKRAWIDEVPLVDELVVMDSDSTDATSALASGAGARVHDVRGTRISGAQDERPGKGEALWKSLGVTTGDILIFLDGDLIEWDVDYVPRLAWPLLSLDHLQLVKAVYDRPMVSDGAVPEESGGRVTELVARPLMARFLPELGHLVQPLSGEWAVRRQAFESFSVPSGYGVEIAAVIDTARRYGSDAVGQIELSRRAHRHHRHDALGLMSLQVMEAVLRRVEDAPTVRSSISMTQYSWGGGRPIAGETLVDVSERPPMKFLVRGTESEAE
jgi:glucosyl-3-phosphoglycerate synthase